TLWRCHFHNIMAFPEAITISKSFDTAFCTDSCSCKYYYFHRNVYFCLKIDNLVDKQLFQYLQEFLTPRRKELFEKILNERTRHITVVAEDVYQMHNASAVMRSCEVFGVQDMHVIEKRFSKRVDKEIAMGAQKWVNLYSYKSSQECINKLRADGYQIVATTPHNDSQYLHDFDVTKKSAFFFGQEKYGLSEEILEQADSYLKIPMHGFTESLNIS